jgi:hypothetical protein
MACADVLYGVTMQESGISRRMAVRFEDWPDDEARPQELDQHQPVEARDPQRKEGCVPVRKGVGEPVQDG